MNIKDIRIIRHLVHPKIGFEDELQVFVEGSWQPVRIIHHGEEDREGVVTQEKYVIEKLNNRNKRD